MATRRDVIKVTSAIGLSAAAASLAAPIVKVAAQSGTMRIGLDVDAGTGDYRLARDSSARRLGELVYDGLVDLDAELNPQPALAESWEASNDTTWVFSLRQGVTFHDGEEFTAEDVVYTFESVLDEEFAAPLRALYTPITSVKALDSHTVEFSLSEPYAPFLSYMDFGIVPKHLGEDPAQDLGENPVGTGPFRMTNWVKNSQIEFEAFADHWRGAPSLAGVTFFIIPDNTVRATALESGDLDLIHSPLSPQDLERLRTLEGITVEEQTALGFTHLVFNTTDPILSDVTVRRALAHLVDKETIANDIYQGMDTPGESPLVPNTWWYSEIQDQPYDPEAAASLFAEAGWEDSDGDGVLEKDGERLTLVLKTHSEDPNRIQAVTFLQNLFSQNGIEASVETAEWPTFRDSVTNQDYQIAMLGWLSLVDPDRAMYNQFLCEGVSNDAKYCNPEVDELLILGRSTLDQEERVGIYRDAAQIIVDDVPYSVVLYQGYAVVMQDGVSGFVPHPSGSFKSLYQTSLQ
jgi:peptide/nickel transport system substrate-binding protein